jgi:hypothetical protein
VQEAIYSLLMMQNGAGVSHSTIVSSRFAN